MVRSFASLLVLRFLTGFFRSPCLANGGASVGDIDQSLPDSLSKPRDGAGDFGRLFETILRRRAQRIQKLTGRQSIFTLSKIAQAQLTTADVVWDALMKPAEIRFKHPAVLFTNLYEKPVCAFSRLELPALSELSFFFAYQLCYILPDFERHGPRAPEHRLVPALFAVIKLSVGYFVFGWTVRSDIHWVVGLIGVVIFVTSNFIIFQSVFVYLPMSYPKYSASLFATNGLCRSLFAVACVLFARPMFSNLGIGGGVFLLAGLSCLGILGMFYLWKYGARLRPKSTFSHEFDKRE
ncbi:hypothetical protein N7494_010048 [Penicillium frequentans]|uniref:Uncharacterized protein n=1 Tax=Penicillium frequentans TaxID=3151616 RepID=A0AAD6GDH2_9EURO|nr:hypothetical protein N7494_010048 [Penicillium glabrum]